MTCRIGIASLPRSIITHGRVSCKRAAKNNMSVADRLPSTTLLKVTVVVYRAKCSAKNIVIPYPVPGRRWHDGGWARDALGLAAEVSERSRAIIARRR